MKTIRNRQKRKSTLRRFLYDSTHPSNTYNLYSNANPRNTIPIHYTTIEDVRQTIQTLESLYKKKKYPHKRIVQVAMILRVRLEMLQRQKPEQYKLAKRYSDFLQLRTGLEEIDRYKVSFSY